MLQDNECQGHCRQDKSETTQGETQKEEGFLRKDEGDIVLVDCFPSTGHSYSLTIKPKLVKLISNFRRGQSVLSRDYR